MVMITINDLDTTAGLLIFQEACRAADACQPGQDHIATSVVGDMTLRHCIETIEQPFKRGWTLWCRRYLSTSMDEGVRLFFSDFATANDARMAAQLCIDHDDMGFDEAVDQLSRWHSSMNDGLVVLPVIEKELETRGRN